jgi:hypothetical protein
MVVPVRMAKVLIITAYRLPPDPSYDRLFVRANGSGRIGFRSIRLQMIKELTMIYLRDCSAP